MNKTILFLVCCVLINTALAQSDMGGGSPGGGVPIPQKDYCGDGTCDGEENPFNCREDCDDAGAVKISILDDIIKKTEEKKEKKTKELRTIIIAIVGAILIFKFAKKRKINPDEFQMDRGIHDLYGETPEPRYKIMDQDELDRLMPKEEHRKRIEEVKQEMERKEASKGVEEMMKQIDKPF